MFWFNVSRFIVSGSIILKHLIGNLCSNVFLEYFVSYEYENVETVCVYHKEKLIINQKCLPYLQQNTYIRTLITRCQKSSRHYHSSRFGQLVSVYCLSLLPNSRNSDSTSLVKFWNPWVIGNLNQAIMIKIIWCSIE